MIQYHSEASHITEQSFPGTVDNSYTYYMPGTEGTLFTQLSNFNPSMDEYTYSQCGLHLLIHIQTTTPHGVCNQFHIQLIMYVLFVLSMLGLRLIHVNKRAPCWNCMDLCRYRARPLGELRRWAWTGYIYIYMGLLTDTKKCGLRMHRECRERFPRHRLQRKPSVNDPGMHHGTCLTHVPWCMSGSLTHGGGEKVPGITGGCATSNFTYLVRGP